MREFHWRNDIFFRRNDSGEVEIVKRPKAVAFWTAEKGFHDPEEPILTIDASNWASIVAFLDYASADEHQVVLLRSPEITPFADYQRWGDMLVSGQWSWVRNMRCKYVNIHLDTRREGYTFSDRDGNPITFAQLCWQYSKDTPTPP